MCCLAAPQGEQTFYSEILSKFLKVSFILSFCSVLLWWWGTMGVFMVWFMFFSLETRAVVTPFVSDHFLWWMLVYPGYPIRKSYQVCEVTPPDLNLSCPLLVDVSSFKMYFWVSIRIAAVCVPSLVRKRFEVIQTSSKVLLALQNFSEILLYKFK